MKSATLNGRVHKTQRLGRRAQEVDAIYAKTHAPPKPPDL
jgi:hypothetical protein